MQSKVDEGFSKKLAEMVIEGMQELKALDIVKMDLRNIENSVCDFFVICHGTSSTQVDAIASSVEKEISEVTGDKPWKKEGFSNSQWILLDYVHVVVHVFQQDAREFYNLEDLWADAEVQKIEEIAG